MTENTDRYDLLVFRDTDGGTDSYFFKNGQSWTEYNEFTFDNGNATELSSIRERAYDALNNPETPEGIKDTLREGFGMEQDSSYVEDDSENCTVCGSEITQYPTYPDEGQKVGYLDSNWQLGFDGHEHTLVEEDDEDEDEDETSRELSTEEQERIADTQRQLLEELGLLPDDRDKADELNDKMTAAIKFILQSNRAPSPATGSYGGSTPPAGTHVSAHERS